MNRRDKPITLRSIKQLWLRTGRRPVEVPLITKKLLDEVTSQPRRPNPTPLHISSQRHLRSMMPMPHHRLAWTTAACTAALMTVGGIWLTSTTGDEEKGLMIARTEHSIAPAPEENVILPSTSEQPLPETKKTTHTDNRQYAIPEKQHVWQTAHKPTLENEEIVYGDITCYSGGFRSENCDEKTVTTMLMTFS